MLLKDSFVGGITHCKTSYLAYVDIPRIKGKRNAVISW